MTYSKDKKDRILRQIVIRLNNITEYRSIMRQIKKEQEREKLGESQYNKVCRIRIKERISYEYRRNSNR